jgi:hypothetical protein
MKPSRRFWINKYGCGTIRHPYWHEGKKKYYAFVLLFMTIIGVVDMLKWFVR